jgi:hypothetical protein
MLKFYRVRYAQGLAVAAVLATSAPAIAGYDLTLSGLTDEDGGVNYNAYLGVKPNDNWSLSADIGHTTSSVQFSNFSGTSYGLSADLHNDRFGASLGWRSWDDSNNFESRITSGKLYWRNAALEIGLLLEKRDYSVLFTFTPPIVGARPVSRTASFAGDGVGLSVSWYGDVWGAYAQYQDNSYDSAFTNTISTLVSLNPQRRPGLAALAASVITKANGVTDNEFSAGLNRSFARSGLRLDAYRVKDQINGGNSTGVSLGYRYSISPTVTMEATVGSSHSDSFQGQMYGGLSVTFRH